jgi:hypothetical protein
MSFDFQHNLLVVRQSLLHYYTVIDILILGQEYLCY